MFSNDLLYQLCLTDIPNIGCVHARTLCEQFASAQDIFRASQFALERIPGIGEIRARSIKQFRNFHKAEKEMAFMQRYRIEPLFITAANYPQRLLHCYDPPVLLFFKGTVNLNAPRMISIVGTRNHSDYGRLCTEKLVKALAACGVIVVSGLAFGVDAVAHRHALKAGTPTIGVVGHGLDVMYPPEHANLAREMQQMGGLLTEFKSNTKPDKHNFPSRNRIVAGITDATVIIESGVRGGSMITAELAHGYSRDVFAIPGRVTDSRSAGCNQLIRTNKAILLSEPEELIDILGWKEQKLVGERRPASLFPDLTEPERKVVNLLKNSESVALDELHAVCGIRASDLAAALLSLEMRQLAQTLPGRRFRLIDRQL